MLLAAALLGANLLPSRAGLVDSFMYYKSFDHTDGVHSIVFAYHYNYGWPFPAQRVQPGDWIHVPVSEKPQGFRMRQVYQAGALKNYAEGNQKSVPTEWRETYKEPNIQRIWDGTFAALNAGVAAGILLLAAILSEILCRRRRRSQKLS